MATVLDTLALGRRHQQAGDLARAEQLYRQVLQAAPSCLDAWRWLAETCTALGRPGEALACLHEALRLNPQDALLYNQLGVTLGMQARRDEAAASFRQGLAILRQELSFISSNLGNVLRDHGDLGGAVEALQEALRFFPGFAEPHHNLALTLARLGRLDEAAASYREAVRLRPDLVQSHLGLSAVLLRQGEVEQACASCRRALDLNPAYAEAHSSFLLTLNYHPGVGPDELLAEHRRWDSVHGQVRRAGPAPGHDRDPERRLRVGYVSPDFRLHPVAYFLLPILAHHDPGRVETVCYAEVDPAEADEVTALLRGLAHAWRPTFCQRAGAVADQVRADGIDVLVDLAGHTRHNRLDVFALKPAPVQVTYLGYPNTTGLAAVDYRLSDAVADPPGEPARHSEEVVRLPAGFCCYAPPDGAPDVTPLPARRNGRVTFGVFHHLAKLNAGVLDLWGAILRALPEARLLMARDTLTGSTKEAFARRFAERGVSGDRVELRHVTPKALRHLDLYAEVDIALDPFPWTGHTTACEAAWMGVPVVTLRGDRHAGRMVASVLTQLGLPELIGDTPEQYLAAAVRLAGDVEGLARLRAGLRGRMRDSPLCDGRGFTRGLEEAYRRMWRRWCAGGQA